MTGAEHMPVEVLRPAGPVAGDQTWVTVRAGIPDRVVPRPVTWLRTPLDNPKPATRWAWDADWDLRELHDRDDPEWYESIYTAMGERTALHIVQHAALAGVHVALHGADVETPAADLVSKLGAEILPGVPDGWERTAP